MLSVSSHPRRPGARRARPALERLGDRTLPAVAVAYRDGASTVTADSAGNVYVAGGLQHWVDVDPGPGQNWLQGWDRSSQAPGSGAGFLAKYSPSGALLWSARANDESSGFDEIETHTDGTNTSVYLARMDYKSTTTKYGGDGTLLWQKDERPIYSRFAVDSSGAVYFVGGFTGTVDMDGSNPSTAADTLTADGTDVYVIKWDAGGNFLWAKQLGGPGNQGVAGNPQWGPEVEFHDGDLFVSGNFSGAMTAGSFTLTDQGAAGTSDGFVLRLDLDGNVEAAFQLADRSTDARLAVDASGIYLMAGGLLTRMSHADGSAIWSKQVQNPASITVSEGAVYLTGAFQGTPDFDPAPSAVYNLTASGNAEIFVEKLSAADGTFVWAKQMGGSALTADEMGRGIVASGGGVYSVGWFWANDADFDPGSGTALLNAEGNREGYVSKLDTDGNHQWAFSIGNQTRTIDNGQAGYTEVGTGWKANTGGGFDGDARYHAKGNGSNKARWTYTGLPPGATYEVLVTWNAATKNATNAAFKVNGVSVNTVNQRVAPADYQNKSPYANPHYNRLWERLETGTQVTFTADASGTITVELSDLANGNVVADAVQLVGMGPAGNSLLAAGPAPGNQTTQPITDADLRPLVQEAVTRWLATGLSAEQAAALGSIDVRIADLGGLTLGLASGDTIWIDDDAAGWGWFIDPTPGDDSEFTTPGDQGEQNRMDLLSVLTHEIGHLLGHYHDEEGVMAETLEAGVRQAPPPTPLAAPVTPVPLQTPPSGSLPLAGVVKDRVFASWNDSGDAWLALLLDQLERRA